MATMFRSAIRSIILCVAVTAPVEGALITFDSRALFNAAAPGLPVETFEAGLVGPGMATLCSGPLSGDAASGCFPFGGLLTGATYSAVPGPGIVILGDHFILGGNFPPPLNEVGNTSKVLGGNNFSHTFDIVYGNANAVGFDVSVIVFPAPVVISVFSPLDVLLGSFSISAPVGGGVFWGVISDTDLIGRINIESPVDLSPPDFAFGAELIDNHAFGIAQPVPEPASLTLLGLGLAGIAGRCWRQRKRA